MNIIFVGYPLNESVENDLLLPTSERYGQPRLSLCGNQTKLLSPILSSLPIQPMSADATCLDFAASSQTERCADRHSVGRQSLMGKIHFIIKTFKHAIKMFQKTLIFIAMLLNVHSIFIPIKFLESFQRNEATLQCIIIKNFVILYFVSS